MRGKRLVLIGGGGHCESVLDTVLEVGEYDDIVITDPNLTPGTEILGCKVIGTDDMLLGLYQEGYTRAFITVGSVRSTKVRRLILENVSTIGFELINIISPDAIISRNTKMGKGIYIGKGCIINAGTEVSDLAIVNTGAIIEHGSKVGHFAHVSIGAVLCGECGIGDDSLVGANATIIQGVHVGNKSLIGAGAVVIDDVPDGVVAVGNPARVIQKNG